MHDFVSCKTESLNKNMEIKKTGASDWSNKENGRRIVDSLEVERLTCVVCQNTVLICK